MNNEALSIAIPYTLYAVQGRVYASNVEDALIDLGRLGKEDDGSFGFTLDGNAAEDHGFASTGEALQGVAEQLSFYFLDGQFTSLPDCHREVDVSGAERLGICLQDQIEDSVLGAGEATPHIF
jgi:hypothetical protein